MAINRNTGEALPDEFHFKLTKPITFGGGLQTIDSLVIREPNGGDLMDTAHLDNAEQRAIALLALYNNLTPKDLRDMSGGDYSNVLGEFTNYLPDILATGVMCSLGLPTTFISSLVKSGALVQETSASGQELSTTSSEN